MKRRDILKTLIAGLIGFISGIFLRGKKPERIIYRNAEKKIEVLPHCLSCAGCIPTCPPMAIELPFPALRVNQSLCIKCGNCEAVCPVGAIRVLQSA